jgi:hypothetical protein
LLKEPGLEHQLADDLESFFWVLLWVSLRYTSHNLSPELLSECLAAFDQVFLTESSGGLSKSEMLVARRIPDHVKFLSKALNPIFKELSDMFAIRYKPTPTTAENDVYEFMKDLIPDSDGRFQGLYAHLWAQHMKHIKTSHFMLQVLREPLGDRASWRLSDKAKLQSFCSPLSTEKKRRGDQDGIQTNRVSQPKKFKSAGRLTNRVMTPSILEHDDDAEYDE